MTANRTDEDPKMHEMVRIFLKSADLGIEEFRVKKLPEGVRPDYQHILDDWDYEIQFLHKGGTWLDYRDESDGTQRLFSLAVPWLSSLILNDFICLDEIEASMHPFIARELIRIFLSPEANNKGAQLLYTTHNTFLLDQELLRRDQFWFTEKDQTGATHLYPLTDYSPRNTEVLSKGYLAGRYGGVPCIPERLISSAENGGSARGAAATEEGLKQGGKDDEPRE
jgi:hypothetical protein